MSHYKHSCKSSQIAEDARVHCAVLKKQTEPARPPLHPEGETTLAVTRRKQAPLPLTAGGACSFRTQQRVHPANASECPFGLTPRGRKPTGRIIRGWRVSSQCSTSELGTRSGIR